MKTILTLIALATASVAPVATLSWFTMSSDAVLMDRNGYTIATEVEVTSDGHTIIIDGAEFGYHDLDLTDSGLFSSEGWYVIF